MPLQSGPWLRHALGTAQRRRHCVRFSTHLRAGTYLAHLQLTFRPSRNVICTLLERMAERLSRAGLLLKSFLGPGGWTERQLKQCRHELSQLLDDAVNEGLALAPEDRDAIRAVADPARKFVFRYGVVGTSPGIDASREVIHPHPVLQAVARMSSAAAPVRSSQTAHREEAIPLHRLGCGPVRDGRAAEL